MAINRKNFARIVDSIEVPNLVDVQTASFEDFLQFATPKTKRKEKGLQAVFSEVFPIESPDRRCRLEFVNYTIEKPKYDVRECQKRGVTYSGVLKVLLRLVTDKDVKEQEVYFGDMPLMTETGTFIVNGDERVVVSQLHRSPGVCFEESVHPNGKRIYSARIIPYRGAWVEFEFDIYDILYVYLDRRRKFLATTLLRAIGHPRNEDVLKVFCGVEEVNLPELANPKVLVGRISATDIGERNNGEPVLSKGERLTREGLDKLLGNNQKTIRLFRDIYPEILNTLEKDRCKNKEEALTEIYHRLRPGDPATLESAEVLVNRLFFDRQRYDLGRVGRFVINRKLKMDLPLEERTLTSDTIVGVIKYLLELKNGNGNIDDIDHLGNRRVRCVGELLQNQFRIGIARLERSIRERMTIYDLDTIMPHHLINSKLVSAVIRDFFGRSQLSQFMDQTNPLAELTHKRRLSALGPGGLSRERAGFEVRDVHHSHYGRICPIETPEGPNIGLIASLSVYARVNEFGFIEAPYRKVVNGRVTDKIEYLSADIEDQYVIAQANARIDKNGKFLEERISCRSRGNFPMVEAEKVDYMDVSPKQLVSLAASLIPFLEHDDANRALMGSNMQRQAVTLLETEAPLIGTGMEGVAARDSGAMVIARNSGIVKSVQADEIVIENDTYNLSKFVRSNASTCINQRPIVRVGQKVRKGEIIADGAATSDGELALGRNVLVAFMPWRGYNFEDAILLSEKLVKEDVFTSVHIEEFEVEARETRLGNEEITRDIPNLGEESLKNLDSEGIVRIGAEVAPGDILVGKVTPKSETELSPEEKLLRAIFGEKAQDVRDMSLTVPPGIEGVVIDVKVFSRKGARTKSKEELTKEVSQIDSIRKNYQEHIHQLKEEKLKVLSNLLVGKKLAANIVDFEGNTLLSEGKAVAKSHFKKLERCDVDSIRIQNNSEIEEEVRRVWRLLDGQIHELASEEEREIDRVKRGDELPAGVIKKVVVYIASKKKVSVGDKVAGRHGNKGVIAKVLPEEDMPFLPDGTPVEIVLNPLGVPSRMNVGQILETHLGWAARVMGFRVSSPVFDGCTELQIKEELKKANLPEDGKTILFDGLSGEPFDQRVAVGYIYMMKLAHLVDDKIHARSTGPYSLVTQQPLGGKAQQGGQRFGEMEVWALEAYGAAYTLQELLTVKSDDVTGRTRIYETIVKGENALHPGTPESFNVLIKELQSLSLDVRLEKAKRDKILPDDVNTFDAVSIKFASPEVIRSWSKGEVKKPETINYRTFKPEKDGLFCEKIFGPTKDWECNCGKYKRIKHKGVICDRCGVEVTHSKVRRERMGHIDLAAPVSHIWFFKVMPSRLATLLDISLRDLEKVLYYEEYIVTDSGSTPLKQKELLNDDRYNECLKLYGQNWTAKMGAEAVRDLLKKINLDALAKDLQKQIRTTKSEQQIKRAVKILKIVDSFRKSANKPEWMILDVIPVIPPDLRPLVPLDGGRFATSDLNDLYRRVINRNNRLKKLIELKAPEVIIRNEKRMLQEAVDALFDNGRHGRPVMGAGNRPLKSLSDMLKGKQGRFRQNLLGKRVDYSGRSVIVIGPELKLHQCGLPKKMALELFEPFIIKKLKDRGHVHTIKSAKKVVEKAKVEVWDILDEVIKEHPVLLNRAPTLHRLGIQAFEPLLIEGKAIRIHPLICTAFNADFDGDQMAVHVPLSMEAQMEARILMLASNNIFSPSDGRPIDVPTQDLILGSYYLTQEKKGEVGEGKIFCSEDEVWLAFADRELGLHARIKVKINGELVETTVGRVLFNHVLPSGMPFVNAVMDKSNISDIIMTCYKRFGHSRTVQLLDDLKDLGFEQATLAGISISVDDLAVPAQKTAVLASARGEVAVVDAQYQKGLITDGERYNKIIDIWTRVTDQISDLIFEGLDKFNPVFMMADSGARGSRQQIRQLAGMRGLMAKPSGEIIERPITANFREGLSVLDYFISTHGARKGLADTALKTADAGYLTRRLVDVAQDVIVTEEDCGTLNGITMNAIVEGDEVVVSLKERIVGRVALDNIVDVITDQVIVAANEEVTEEKAERMESLGIERIRIRSVLTCETKHGICIKCYGRNLSTGRMVEIGEAVGIIAAQSIGEPGTQLTMRTFHIGGTASRVVEQSYLRTKNSGVLKYHNLKTVETKAGEIIVLNRNGQIGIIDESGRELERYPVPTGSIISVHDGKHADKDEIFVRWDPYTSPILTEVEGIVRYEDIREGITMREELDDTTGLIDRIIVEHKGEFHPQIMIQNDKKDILAFYTIPAGAHIVVKDGQHVSAGSFLAKTPRKVAKTRDITGGLPRVAELFEARRPKNPAIISEIDGVVELGGARRGLRRIVIKSQVGTKKEYFIPPGKHLNVYKGDRVVSGQQLTEGPVVPQDILRICGDKRLQEYLVNEVQAVYRLSGVRINDRHIEVMVRQMLRKVRIEDPGDTSFLIGEQVDKFKFQEENDQIKAKKGKPAKATLLLLGITKAALSTESFISAASFQETTRVLTEAASGGKRDELLGLKENVIMGHLIPAGTGFKDHRNIKVVKELLTEEQKGE